MSTGTAKPQKLVDFDFEHDDTAIRFVEVPRTYYGGDTGSEYPNERRRWEIHINGAMVGYARKPYGFGKQALVVDRLTPSYSAIFGHRELLKQGRDNQNYDLDDLLPLLVAAYRSKWDRDRLVTQEEADRLEREHEQRKQRDEEQAEARRTAERKQRRRDLTEGIEQAKAELEALKEFVARGGWSNIETQALETSLRLLGDQLRSRQADLARLNDWEERHDPPTRG
jgi:hypothetical protein